MIWRRRSGWLIAAAVVVAGVTALLAIPVPVSGPAAGQPGRYLRGTVSERGVSYSYLVYQPPGLAGGRPVPLVVVLHGCQTSAAQIATASQYDALARRERFIVLYPEVSALDITHGQCWQGIWAPDAEGRGSGDAGAIAAMTSAVAARMPVDRSRVYAIGISAGAYQAGALALYYPDRFAAVGLLSGGGYVGGQAGCDPTGAGAVNAGRLARAARAAMGSRARVMPVLVMHGDADTTIPYLCAPQLIALWLAIDNLILAGGDQPAIPAAPAAIRRGSVRGGRAYAEASYANGSGCAVAQLWTIAGMGHFWSGGTADPALALYSDPRGPSAAAASWSFFSDWTLSGPRRPCRMPAGTTAGPRSRPG